MTQKHIVFGIPSLLVGGIEKHIVQQLRYFNRDKYTFSIITLFDYGDREGLFDQVPTDVKIYRLSFKNYFDIKNWYRLVKTLRRIKPDVLVTSMFSANAAFRLVKPFFAFKVITREHNTYTDKNTFHFFTDRILSRLSDRIVAVSETVRDFVAKYSHIKKERIQVIHNGIDIAKVDNYLARNTTADMRKKLGFNLDDKIILNVARLKPQKNQKLLIDAFIDFYAKYKKAHLVVVGDGILKDDLIKYVGAVGMESCIHIVGYKENVFDYYLISDLFVLSSDREGFPNVCIEACSFGLPIVSTLVSGVDEIISNGKNGYIVDRNRASMSRALQDIMGSTTEKYELMRQSAFQTANRFSLLSNIRRYEDLFDTI